MDLNIKKCGQFRLIKQIAKGGMAEIFIGSAGTVESAHKFVVIKRVLLAHSHNKEFNKMFQNEGKIAVNINHSNICSIYEFGIDNNQYFICMEYISGRNLRQLTQKLKSQKSSLNMAMCAHIIRCVCNGLDHAHNCTDSITGQPLNIIHRDISPQNIMVGFSSDIKIIDFGIAKIDDSESTKVGVLKGKFEYMSPEQARGKNLDKQTDIFSLGSILWELLAGKKLFTGNNEIHLLKKIRDCQIPDLKKKNPDIPDRLLEIVNKALSANKNLRYKSAADMGNDLSIFLNKAYPDFTHNHFSTFIKEVYVEEILEERQTLKVYSQALISKKGAMKGGLLSKVSRDSDDSFTFIGYQPDFDKTQDDKPETKSQYNDTGISQASQLGVSQYTYTQTQNDTAHINHNQTEKITKTKFEDALDRNTVYTQTDNSQIPSDGYKNIVTVTEEANVQNFNTGVQTPSKSVRSDTSIVQDRLSATQSKRPKHRTYYKRKKAIFQKAVMGLFIFGVIGFVYTFKSDIKNYVLSVVQKINQDGAVGLGPESLKSFSLPVSDTSVRKPTAASFTRSKLKSYKKKVARNDSLDIEKNVFINTQPSGAHVYINNEKMDQLTPTSVVIPSSGQFQLILKKVGYHDTKVVLSPESVNNMMSFSMKKNKNRKKMYETIVIK